MDLSEELVKELLDKYEVSYVEKGKNIGPDFYGMNCPFCDDSSNHLGINRQKGYFTCWKCRTSGSFFDLLQEVAGITWQQFQADIRVGNISSESALDRIDKLTNKQERKEEKTKEEEIKLPKFVYPVTEDTQSELLDQYLKRRGYTKEICWAHGCCYGKVGPWMHRLIIPIIFKHKMVSFIGADMTGRAILKYKMSETNVNNYVYQYDNIVDTGSARMIVTEGVLDAWRVGEQAVCTFGTHITEQQKQLILGSGLKQLIMAWDGDAYWKAREAVKQFQPFIEIIKIVQFPKDEDPDSYGLKHGVRSLRKLILETESI